MPFWEQFSYSPKSEHQMKNFYGGIMQNLVCLSTVASIRKPLDIGMGTRPKGQGILWFMRKFHRQNKARSQAGSIQLGFDAEEWVLESSINIYL